MTVDVVRRVAVDLIGDVTEKGRLLSEVMARRVEKLAPEERARVQRLVLESFRGMDRADRLLGPFLKKRPGPRVLNILRLGVVEICHGGAAHGVVNACVEIAKSSAETRRQAGLINAVLRKVDPDKWDALPVPRLPKWLRKVLVVDYGKQAVAAMEAAHFAGAPLDVTAQRPVGFGTPLPTGSVRLAEYGQVSALPGYAEGDWWVQDAAAALPAKVLAPAAGARVLDLCAAPGGKTMQLAASGARVTAVDISRTRMGRVEENLRRCGLSAELVVSDALRYEAAPFDAVLLDAPCSATGTIRRHPDLPHAKDGGDFPALFELQAHLIDHALGLLKPGGRLVFCTCSLLIDEGEEQVRDAMVRHAGLTPDLKALHLPGVDPAWIGPEGLRLRPDFWADAGGMDGFFIAALRKPF